MQASKRHMELENGEGLCSRPMWCGGMPAGFCDNPAYGEQEKGQTRSGEWLYGKFNPSYCAGLACYAHGGPKEPPAPADDPADMEKILAGFYDLSTALRETLAREQAGRVRAEKAEHNECCLRAALEELGYTGTVPEGVWDALAQRAEKAEADLADLTQTTGELCPECHWRGVRDDGCEFCKAHRLEADLAAARKELAGLEGGAQ